jgi:hypothetical protein
MKPFVKDKNLPELPSWENYSKQFENFEGPFTDIKLPSPPTSIPQICFPVKTPAYNVIQWVYICGWKMSWVERLKVFLTGKIYNYTWPASEGGAVSFPSILPPVFTSTPADKVPPGHKTLTDLASTGIVFSQRSSGG